MSASSVCGVQCEAQCTDRNPLWMANRKLDIKGLGCYIQELGPDYISSDGVGAVKVWGFRVDLQSSKTEVISQQHRQGLGEGQAGERNSFRWGCCPDTQCYLRAMGVGVGRGQSLEGGSGVSHLRPDSSCSRGV